MGNKPLIMNFSQNAPNYRIVNDGLNIEGDC